MKDDIWVEIRDTGHIKWYEASKSTEMTEEEIENDVFEIVYEGAHRTEKKTISVEDLETVLSTIFI